MQVACAAEFKGPGVLPYGDVDAVVGVSNLSSLDKVGRGVARHLGGRNGARLLGSGRCWSVLTDEGYQVDLRFCFEEEAEFLVAMKGNNDFSGIFGGVFKAWENGAVCSDILFVSIGHLLSPFKLKLSDSGFKLKQEVPRHSFGQVGPHRSQDLLLSRDPAAVCAFLGVPPHAMDGQTRLSVAEVFEAIMGSNVYFHGAGQFAGEYWTDKARAKRPMFQKVRSHIEAYDGRFEAGKDSSSEIRRHLRERWETGDRRRFEDFVLDFFGVREEGEAARRAPPKQKTREENFNKGTLFEWYPSSMTEEVAREVVAVIKARKAAERPGKDERWNYSK